MGHRKSTKLSLKDNYPILSQIGTILSLLLLIAAFKFDLVAVEPQAMGVEPMNIIEIEEFQITRHVAGR